MHGESTKNKQGHRASKNKRAKCRLQRINMHKLWPEIGWVRWSWSPGRGRGQGQHKWVNGRGAFPSFPWHRARKVNPQKKTKNKTFINHLLFSCIPHNTQISLSFRIFPAHLASFLGRSEAERHLLYFPNTVDTVTQLFVMSSKRSIEQRTHFFFFQD